MTPQQPCILVSLSPTPSTYRETLESGTIRVIDFFRLAMESYQVTFDPSPGGGPAWIEFIYVDSTKVTLRGTAALHCWQWLEEQRDIINRVRSQHISETERTQ